MPESRRERWERRWEWPLMAAAVAFLVAYAWPILDPGLDDTAVAVCRTVSTVAWVVFVADYLVRLRLSRDRRTFFRTHLLDLAIVAAPILRPLRLLRLVSLLAILNRHAGDSLRGRVAVYVGGATALVLLVASLAILDVERGAEGSRIGSFGEALWWAMTTVTTVGYGDLYPVTTSGRLIAAGLMLAGIALLGVVTASLASWLIERVAEVEQESEAATRKDIAELRGELQSLRAELRDQASSSSPPQTME